jgi:hypothetical protein
MRWTSAVRVSAGISQMNCVRQALEAGHRGEVKGGAP